MFATDPDRKSYCFCEFSSGFRHVQYVRPNRAPQKGPPQKERQIFLHARNTEIIGNPRVNNEGNKQKRSSFFQEKLAQSTYLNITHLSVSLHSEHVSGAENGAERPENRVERSGAMSGRSRSGNGAWSGLNWPLTARSNVIFH